MTSASGRHDGGVIIGVQQFQTDIITLINGTCIGANNYHAYTNTTASYMNAFGYSTGFQKVGGGNFTGNSGTT